MTVGILAAIVVVPKTQTHNAPEATTTNEAPAAGEVFNASTYGRADFKIEIFDQFGKPLAEVYNADGKVQEQFTDPTGNLAVVFFPAFGQKHTISMPDGKLKDGVITDRSQPKMPANYLIADAGTAKKWEDFEHYIDGLYNNAAAKQFSAVPDGKVEVSAMQEIFVWGHAVTPKYKRKIKITNNNVPPSAFYISDTAEA